MSRGTISDATSASGERNTHMLFGFNLRTSGPRLTVIDSEASYHKQVGSNKCYTKTKNATLNGYFHNGFTIIELFLMP